MPVDSPEQVNAPPAPAVDDSGEAPAAAPGSRTAEISQLAHDAAAYARALGHLALSEAALARVNFVRLLLLALAVPAIVFGILLGVDALLVALALRLINDWILAVISALAINIALLAVTLILLRRWWHTLSLPRSRAAIARALETLK